MSLRLFEGHGLELEYMIVDGRTLDVLPIADRLLAAAAGADSGELCSDADRGSYTWSNELVQHVLELKTTNPAPALSGLAAGFQGEVDFANRILGPFGARLLPTAMHPWMDPWTEMKLWPGDCNEVYRAFDRIFDCRGHGWSNLQSAHLNLPFADDEEFGRLHAAIRLVLPIIPALAASSPVAEGRSIGPLDKRMEFYRHNSDRVPTVAGLVIPERAFSRADYEGRILEPMYRDIAALDKEGLLHGEFLNARGAIARFSRGSIEVRVIDVQECPAADLAVGACIVAAIRGLVEERWTSCAAQRVWEAEPLAQVFLSAVRDAEAAVIDDPRYLGVFGYRGSDPCTAGGLWAHVVDELQPVLDPACERALDLILRRGTLARRILRALGQPGPAGRHGREALRAVYGELADCLAGGRSYP